MMVGGGFNQGNKQIHACHDDLIQVAEDRVHKPADDFGNGGNDSSNNLRKRLNQGNQQFDACFDDERNGVNDCCNDAVDDFRNRFHDCCDDFRQSLYQ